MKLRKTFQSPSPKQTHWHQCQAWGANLSSESWLKFNKRQIKTIKREDWIQHVRIRDLVDRERSTSLPQRAPAPVQSDTCWVRRVGQNALNVNLFTLQPPQMTTRRAMHLRATLTATGRVGEQNVLKNQQHDVKDFNKSGKWPLISDCVCVVGNIVWNCSLVKLFWAPSSSAVRAEMSLIPSNRPSQQLGLTLNPKAAAGIAETR